MIRGFSRRGQPLIALVLLLGSWVSARAMMWDSTKVSLNTSQKLGRQFGAEAVLVKKSVSEKLAQSSATQIMPGLSALPKPNHPEHVSTVKTAQQKTPTWERGETRTRLAHSRTTAPVFTAAFSQPFDLANLADAPGQNLVGSRQPAARPGLSLMQPTAGVSTSVYPEMAQQAQTSNRWSIDSWFFWRRGGEASLPGGILTPSYGASQAGMVLRYRLTANHDLRPTAYLRTTTALNGSGERDAAVGVSARPFTRIPLLAAGEARISATASGYVLRPAAFLVSEFPAFALPMGLRGEAYGQAGYVGGRYATAFADGQFRSDRRLLQLGRGDLRLGGGLWGGAQQGASRLDAGPSLTFGQPIGRSGGVRLSADWRFRVAGNAAPASGPAITLSAGF